MYLKSANFTHLTLKGGETLTSTVSFLVCVKGFAEPQVQDRIKSHGFLCLVKRKDELFTIVENYLVKITDIEETSS